MTPTRRPRRAATAAITTLLALIGTLATSGSPAGAVPVSYDITTTADGIPGSLRAAISDANANATAADTVTFLLPSGTYDLTLCGGVDDDLNVIGDLDQRVDVPITLRGTGPNVVMRQTCAGARVFDQHGADSLTLDNVTVSGGSITSATTSEPAQGGGVRAVVGDVVLENATVTGNSAAGAPATPVTPDGGAALGGGLYVQGSLFATSSTVSANTATAGNGLDATPSSGAGGNGGEAEGGGAFVVGDATIVGGTFASNTATAGRGGSSDDNPGSGALARGGALALERLAGGIAAFTGTLLDTNVARGGDSGAYVQTPSLPPWTYPSAGAAAGGGVAADVFSASHVTAGANRALGGSAGMGACPGFGGTCPSPGPAGSAHGGAFAAEGPAAAGESTVTSSTFTGNQATSGDSFLIFFSQAGTPIGNDGAPAFGGAVWVGEAGTIAGSAFTQNGVTQGIGFPHINGFADGGAVAASAMLSIDGGSFTGNTSTQGQGGAAASGGTMVVTNATFTSNTATGGSGGALHAFDLQAADSTFAQNTGGGSGGGAIKVDHDANVVRSSITGNTVRARYVHNSDASASGGGILAAGNLALADSFVSGNAGQATFTAGILCRDCPLPFYGGGVSAANVIADAVTVTSNTATAPAGGPFESPGPAGGGIYATTSASLTNTTVANNTLVVTFTDGTVVPAGSAIRAPAVTLDHATLAENTNGATVAATTLTTHRSAAIAATGQSVCATGIGLSASSYNAFNDTSCGLAGTGDQQGPAAFLLGPVTDNGGPVPTMLPAPSSVLVDAIPSASCPIPVDARDIARPQGSACDVGAVEATVPTDTGPADVAVSFVAPPASVVPGTDGTWTLAVVNHGPNGTRPALSITVPAGVAVVSASATGGGACGVSGSSLDCVWGTTIAAGASATVTVVGHVDSAVVDALSFHAAVSAPGALPPFDDDAADLTTVVTPRANVRMTVQFERTWDTPGHVQATLLVDVFNDGPSNALGTTAAPIDVEFIPAPGVHGTGESFTGSFAPSNTEIRRIWINVTFDPGTPMPAVVGTLVLHPGATPDPDGTGHTVEVAGTDLGVVVSRDGGVQAPGAPTTFTMTVANQGAGTAEDVVVSLSLSDVGTPIYEPSIGVVSDEGGLWGPSWQIESLAPGETAVLRGTVAEHGSFARLDARVSSDAVDANEENDTTTADLRFAPNGTADLRVDRVRVFFAAPGQRILRATIKNYGLSPVTANAIDKVSVTLLTTPEAHAIRAVSRTPGWRCSTPDPYWSSCSSAISMPAGATVTVDFAVEGTFPDTQPRLGVTTSAPLSIDPRLHNNTRFVNAAFAWPWPPTSG